MPKGFFLEYSYVRGFYVIRKNYHNQWNFMCAQPAMFLASLWTVNVNKWDPQCAGHTAHNLVSFRSLLESKWGPVSHSQ